MSTTFYESQPNWIKLLVSAYIIQTAVQLSAAFLQCIIIIVPCIRPLFYCRHKTIGQVYRLYLQPDYTVVCMYSFFDYPYVLVLVLVFSTIILSAFV
jgi:hypothetical protein